MRDQDRLSFVNLLFAIISEIAESEGIESAEKLLDDAKKRLKGVQNEFKAEIGT